MSDEEFTPTEWEVREQYAGGNIHAEAEYDRMIAEVERAAAARALEEVANDLRVSFSRGAAIAMHHQCHKKQCRCGNPGNDEIVRAVFDAAREELRARAEAYRQERGEQ